MRSTGYVYVHKCVCTSAHMYMCFHVEVHTWLWVSGWPEIHLSYLYCFVPYFLIQGILFIFSLCDKCNLKVPLGSQFEGYCGGETMASEAGRSSCLESREWPHAKVTFPFPVYSECRTPSSVNSDSHSPSQVCTEPYLIWVSPHGMSRSFCPQWLSIWPLGG